MEVISQQFQIRLSKSILKANFLKGQLNVLTYVLLQLIKNSVLGTY